ncbi:dephospho-CoA kinase [Advenella mimigardefordensis]|uniref:Dephospho-CoA kinase n=1 Tax=Advenella mimigardefordensis (strain DSM 17166 / LMG 22922 / DPN7) TaxID=1247726 RepID=W0PC78_ADVMD|nr:dephospho-CoA kinase [Advenella mimigardefordensis]AHG63020.1 dephospho-CoA kinase [Advenella mimigardefordensis DPN7]
MYRIGLTGGIGSGKSTVSQLLAARGASVIDADALSRSLTQPGGKAMPAIAQAFGSRAVQADGAMDRAYMRQQVFQDVAKRRQLEQILHPLIGQATQAAAAAATGLYLVYDIPLLVESLARYRPIMDRICVVDCEETEQIARVQARSGLSVQAVTDIMSTQARRQQRLAAADDVIFNGAGITLAMLEERVQQVHEHWLQLSGQQKTQ